MNTNLEFLERMATQFAKQIADALAAPQQHAQAAPASQAEDASVGVVPQPIEGQSDLSKAILTVIYRCCQRGDSPERLHAAVMVALAQRAASVEVVPSASGESPCIEDRDGIPAAIRMVIQSRGSFGALRSLYRLINIWGAEQRAAPPAAAKVAQDSENMNSPSHPRFVAGFKAGHEAGRGRAAQDSWRDAARLDFLDQNMRFNLHWRIGRAVAGNLTMQLIENRHLKTTIRESIDAAMAAQTKKDN